METENNTLQKRQAAKVVLFINIECLKERSITFPHHLCHKSRSCLKMQLKQMELKSKYLTHRNKTMPTLYALN